MQSLMLALLSHSISICFGHRGIEYFSWHIFTLNINIDIVLSFSLSGIQYITKKTCSADTWQTKAQTHTRTHALTLQHKQCARKCKHMQHARTCTCKHKQDRKSIMHTYIHTHTLTHSHTQPGEEATICSIFKRERYVLYATWAASDATMYRDDNAMGTTSQLTSW